MANWSLADIGGHPIDVYSVALLALAVLAVQMTEPPMAKVSYVERAKKSAACGHGPDQRMTKAHLATSALQAYHLGAAGISSFNFQYYREFADKPCMLEENKPYSEPPFKVLSKLSDRDWVARQDQYYWSNMQRAFSSSKHDASFTLVAPAGGWQQAGKVRINLEQSLKAGDRMTLTFNGAELVCTTNSSIPFPSEYADRFEGEYTSWLLPAALVKTGENKLQFAVSSQSNVASSATIIAHIDILLPVEQKENTNRPLLKLDDDVHLPVELRRRGDQSDVAPRGRGYAGAGRGDAEHPWETDMQRSACGIPKVKFTGLTQTLGQL
jgi:hypothetical protein